MLVYGDQDREVATGPMIRRLADEIGGIAAVEPWIGRHGRAMSVFVEAASLLQGIADVEHAAQDADGASPVQDALMAMLTGWAGALDRHWRGRGASPLSLQVEALIGLLSMRLPDLVRLRRCEGFAFYALYPEQLAGAARGLPSGTLVIGLRSIGAALAPLVAAAVPGASALTVRPVGPPFDRRIVATPALTERIRHHGGAVAIVDEGPGLSGSSFGGTADWLQACGVTADRIVFLPSHAGEPGREASPAHLARWRAATRLSVPFERLFGEDAPRPLDRWFEDLVGPPLRPLEDLSGGGWRSGADVPADPGREARKFRLTTASGRYLIKFAGLDGEGAAKLDRARALAAAGFAPRPIALRYGMLLERWEEGSGIDIADPAIVPTLARYLRFRAAAFPAVAAGAGLRPLAAMARRNLDLAIGANGAALLDAWPGERLARLGDGLCPVHVDGRLHPWEWLRTGDRILKTDAVDHSVSHDLIGPQDIAWDVAGAIVEFDLDTDAAATLIDTVLGGRDAARAVLPFMRLCYLAFQIGWWSYAADPSAVRRMAHYVERVRRPFPVRSRPG